jgi:anti-sigma B factor antagonist
MDFFSALSLHAPNAHLLAKGELDAFAAAVLYRRLDEAIDDGCLSYTVDVSGVTFVDAGGLGMLVRLSNAVAPFGGTVTVTAASPRFRQIADVVGLGDAFGLDLLSLGGSHEPSHRLTPTAAHLTHTAVSHVACSVDQRCRQRSAR